MNHTPEAWPLVKKFFDYLEANADEYWDVPRLDLDVPEADGDEDDDEEESLFEAAYEGVTFRDSADDDIEGAVIDGGPPQRPFDLEQDAPRVEKRLRFLSTVARLWQVAARWARPLLADGEARETAAAWLERARANEKGLLHLLHAVHGCAVPDPGGTYDGLVEYDRRRVLKEQLLEAVITSCLDVHLAGRALRGSLTVWGTNGADAACAALAAELRNHGLTLSEPQIEWEPWFMRLEHALLHGRADEVRRVLPRFLAHFRQEPLLYVALAAGGHPRRVLQVRLAQRSLRVLLEDLPRLGLLRETFHLLKTARAVEQEDQTTGKRVSEFNRLFESAYPACVECLAAAAGPDARAEGVRELVALVQQVIAPFVALWVEHSRTLQMSVLDTVRGDTEWQALGDFIRRYGGDLFHARFLVLANLRGVLHAGVGAYFDYLRDNPDPLQPVRLLDDLDTRIPRAEAERRFQCVLQAVVENYEEYRDYNTTTTQSDYGENLHLLLEFLRLKANYERHARQFRPLLQAHEILARRGLDEAARLWEEAFVRLTRDLGEQHVRELAQLEQTHGLRLRSVADRVQERFARPLALDRLCALIEPVLTEAEQSGAGAALARLEEELRPHTRQPTGAGLDVPAWVRRLEVELHRVRAARTAVVQLAEDFFRVPRVRISADDVRQQLRAWDVPLLGDGPSGEER